MSNINSDIIEVRLYDHNYQIYFRGDARVKDKKDMRKLSEDIAVKNNDIILKSRYEKGDWFE